MPKKPTVEQLLAEIDSLKRRIAQLESRAPAENHYHTHHHAAPALAPTYFPKIGDIFCATSSAVDSQPLTWIGPRNIDGSFARLTISAHGGGSGG